MLSAVRISAVVPSSKVFIAEVKFDAVLLTVIAFVLAICVSVYNLFVASSSSVGLPKLMILF